MSIPVLTTKFLIPPRRLDWVIRPRLTRRLDQGLQRRLTLISAPAGFGKTTLVASWLHGLTSRQHIAPRVGWLSLEEDDNDLVRFLSYFIAAWQTIDAGMGQTARQLLEMPRVPQPQHLMTLLINDLARLPEQSILVLDDYHVINHPELQTAVAFFLDHLPPHSQVVMATREEPSLPLPRLRARSEVLEIRLQDLRFTREETAAFLKRTMGLALTADEAQALENHTEGWVAGLQMAALSLRGRPAPPGSDTAALEIDSFGGGQRDIIDYLAAEVLRQQPPEICAFLRQTAILDRFNASLCAGVTGHQDAQAMLAHLERANLFLIPLDDQRQWYRYHHLFADFLRTELNDADQRHLHAKASRWYEANGSMPEAIKHALAARDYVTAVRLIRLGAEEACTAGKYNTLLSWVNALPEKVVRAHSDLLVHKGWILYLRGEIVTGEAYAALAVENQRADDLPLHRGMLLGFRAYLAINRDEAQQAVKFAQEALTLLGESESFYRTTALSHLGQAERLTGDRKAAIHSLRQTIALGQRLGHHLPVLEALGYLTLLLNQQGKLREAILSCEQAACRYLDAQGHPVPVAGLVYVPLGTLYYEMNDLAKAYHYLTTGIALCQQMGTVYYALVGQRALAKLYYAKGDVEAMWETLAAARELATNSENSRRIRRISAVTAELQLRQGITAAAVHTLADLPTNPGKRTEQENLTYARLLLAQGQAQAAQELLKDIEQSAQQRGRLSSLISIYLLQALTHQALNNTPTALDCLEQALCLAAPEGYRRVFLDEGQPIATLLAQSQHVAPAFVASLLKTFAKYPTSEQTTVTPTLSIATQPLVEPLSETQLNILRLVAAGLSNRDIAAKLAITEGTTKWHLNQVYGKLNVCSRTQAVAQARQRRLL
jgi:LuxR family transcriptional regulator, maltose regulon positive regulatory protein